MFGLMKHKGAAPQPLPGEFRRLHYCGVCKALGKNYGQSARVVLNHDAVFIAELLSAIAENPEECREWEQALQSINCFYLPKNAENIPLPLQFGADVNMLLGCIKIQDNREDGSRMWGLADRWYKKFGEKARERLAAQGLDMAFVEAKLARQSELEKSTFHPKNMGMERFLELSEPTAAITRHVFETGSAAISRPEFQKDLGEVGIALGRIVFWLDALEDYAADGKKERFNPLQVAFGELGEETKKRVEGSLWEEAKRFRRALTALGLEEEVVQFFAGRLEEKLPGEPAADCRCTPASSCKAPKKKISLRERSQLVRNLNKAWTAPGFAGNSAIWKTALGFGAAASIAFVAPALLESLGHLFKDFDPDWSNGLNDATSGTSLDPQVRGGCCQNCDCDNCCNNCGNECEETCNTLLVIVIIICVLLGIGLVVGIIFLVRALSKGNNRNAPVGQRTVGTAPFEYKIIVEYPGQNMTQVIENATAKIQQLEPLADIKQVLTEPDRKVFNIFREMPFTAKHDGADVNLGTVSYRMTFHAIDGKVAWILDQFVHNGSNDVPAGGELGRLSPLKTNKIMTVKTWERIRGMTHKRVEKVLGKLSGNNSGGVNLEK